MDRTNWKFGETNINILVIGIVHQGVAFPLLLKMMDKFGNSNTLERIELLNQYNELFGFETIDVLVADREFVGSEWLDYLNTNEIAYHIRIRENFDVRIPRNNRIVKASWLFSDLKRGQFKHYPKIVYINKVACYLSASVIKSKTGQSEYQFLISFNNFEAYDDYVKIHTTKKTHLKKKTLSYYEKTLDQPQFIRIHRSFVLNLSELTGI